MTRADWAVTDRASELAQLRAAISSSRVVNVHGPLGVGKSWLVRQVPGATILDPHELAGWRDRSAGPLVVDNVDGAGAREAVLAWCDAREPTSMVIVSRSRLPVGPGLPAKSTRVIAVSPLDDDSLDAIVEVFGRHPGEEGAAALRLTGGLPGLAAAAVHAIETGTAASAVGALADVIGAEILTRLARELPGRRWQQSLRLLAAVGAADESLLGCGPELFTALAELSVVRRTEVGLSLIEPFRTVLAAAYEWRRPESFEAARVRASAYRRDRLAQTSERTTRAALVEQCIYLDAPAPVRKTLFPAVSDPGVVGQAVSADAEGIAQLMRQWSERSGFDRRRTAALVEGWLADGVSAFHVLRDDTGQLSGLTRLDPIAADRVDGIEPLLQQHTDDVMERFGDGLLLGAAFGVDRGAHAQILRYTLAAATKVGRLVVSTTNPDYQELVQRLRFTTHGAVRDDIYRCGRTAEIYSNDFTGRTGIRWAAMLSDATAATPVPTAPAELAAVLQQLDDPIGLAASPLLASAATPTVGRLQEWVRQAVAELAASSDPVQAESGQILVGYFLRPSATHRQVATRMHLSRATYFRRLQSGLAALAARFDAAEAQVCSNMRLGGESSRRPGPKQG